MFRKRGKQEAYEEIQRVASRLSDDAFSWNCSRPAWNILARVAAKMKAAFPGLTDEDWDQVIGKAIRVERGRRWRK